ncbi:MAG: bifunctional phosphoribosylaminoimidazolecarboxamide formyltransferase/IMP cyclohydrolase, partial [Amylibacter sp.]|nr:bifunctional phosphoribosylaminoimidazolecarboxamide formyltransferase/IMP cyclohydrolase [Amylibacter sp.]
FGGIIALNDTLDKETAEQISQIFTEVVIAPNATDEAKAIFANKKNLRLLTTQGLPDMNDSGEIWRQVSGGYLIQDRDNGSINRNNLEVVTKRKPTENEISDMLFAWKVAKHVKSNAIVYVKDNATVGIGAGQMNRLDSTRIAARKSKDMSNNIGLSDPLTIGSVVASDAFFPFSDGLLAAAEAGATAIIQPGGSMRDDEVISAANDAGLAMVFTNMRHFKH